MRGHDPDIIGTPPPTPDPVAGLPMFSPAEASVDVPVIEHAPGRVLEMPGYGTLARRGAREKVAPHLRSLRGKVYRVIEAYGPITRTRIAEISAIKVNTVNGRVAELIALKVVKVVGIDADSGEGLVALRAVETGVPDGR